MKLVVSLAFSLAALQGGGRAKHETRRMKEYKQTLLVLLWSLLVLTCSSVAQQSTTQEPWGGWARCEINVSGQGYSDKQTHTWMINGTASMVSGAFRVYPATWSVVGSGSVQKTQGTQTLVAQWATNAQNLSAPLAVFVRASDGRMFIQARHAQERSPRSVNGYQQVTIDGKPQKPASIAAEAFEWAFPVVEVSRPTAGATLVANGSSTPLVNGKVGLMQPAGTQGTAACTWQFGQGAAAPAPPAAVGTPSTPTPPGPPGLSGQQNGSHCISPPRDLAATSTTTAAVTITWTAPLSGTPSSYVIEASNAPGGPANLADFNTGNSSPSLTVPDVPAGTYYVRARAVASCGTSAPSNEVALVIPSGNAASCPSAPRDLKSSVAGSTVTLTWIAPTTGVPASYIVQAGSQAGMANLANFDTGSNVTNFQAQNVPGGSYYIRIYGKNSCGMSPASNEVLMVVP